MAENPNELDYSRKVADGERLELIMRQVASRFKLDGNVLAEALLDIHERLKAVEGATEELTSSDRWKAFKTVQLAKPSPSASGDTVTAIDTVAQDENGELTATKKNIRQGTTSQKGIVQLSDATNSTSTALAATANAVKRAYDLAASKQGAVSTDTDSSDFSDTTTVATGFGSDKIHLNVASRLWNYIKGKLGISSSGSATKFLNEQGEWATVTTPDVSNKLDKDGLGDNVSVEFTEATNRTNIATGSKLSTLFGQIRKWLADLKSLAFKDKVGAGDVDSGTYNIDISGNAAMLLLPREPVNDYNGLESANRFRVAEMGDATTNRPSNNWYHVITSMGSDPRFATQIAVGMTTRNVYYRLKLNGVWESSWTDMRNVSWISNGTFPDSRIASASNWNAKADGDKSVAIFDGYVRRMDESSGWRRLAYKRFNSVNTNLNALFRLYLIGGNADHVGLGNLIVNIRFNSSGSAPDFRLCYLMGHKPLNTAIKLKVIGVAGNAVVEVWFRPPTFSMLLLTYLGGGLDVSSSTKDWTFERYLDAIDPEPVEDIANNVYVFSGTTSRVQINITNPIDGNLVAMDANGLVKDSGKAVNDFAASSHTHGNIQNDGALQTDDITIANGDKLVVADSSDSGKVARASISFDGSTTTKALTQKGTWETFAKLDDITAAIQALDVSGKADKVAGATAGDVATLDANGNLVDSGVTLNPSTNTLAANISGNAATATTASSATSADTATTATTAASADIATATSSGSIPADADLNNYNTANRYYLCNAANAPSVSNKPSGASGAFELEVIRGTGSSCVQVYYSRDDVNFNYIRKCTGLNDGTWTGWVKLVDSSDLNKSAGDLTHPCYVSGGVPIQCYGVSTYSLFYGSLDSTSWTSISGTVSPSGNSQYILTNTSIIDLRKTGGTDGNTGSMHIRVKGDGNGCRTLTVQYLDVFGNTRSFELYWGNSSHFTRVNEFVVFWAECLFPLNQSVNRHCTIVPVRLPDLFYWDGEQV